MRLKTSLDLDGVVFEFDDYYVGKFGIPNKDSDITKNVMNVLRRDNEFWLQQPLLNIPNFVPHCYCTARVITKQLIKKQIAANNLPKSPVYQVMGFGLSKALQLKRSGADCHVDDSIHNFIDLNLKGIPCLLMDGPHNQDWGPIGRIYSLDREEIEDSYYLFKDTLFPYFKEIVSEFKGH